MIRPSSGSLDTIYEVLEGDQPFMAIHEGDLIDPHIWPGSNSPMKVLRAAKVSHIVWKAAGGTELRHKVMVYTEEVDHTRELIFGPED